MASHRFSGVLKRLPCLTGIVFLMETASISDLVVNSIALLGCSGGLQVLHRILSKSLC